jgi:hypothetical protein
MLCEIELNMPRTRTMSVPREKSVASGFLILASKPELRFSDLALKITATVSWFVTQNQVGYGWSVAP